MALFFHAFEVDHLITLKEAVQIAQQALRDLGTGRGSYRGGPLLGRAGGISSVRKNNSSA